MFKRKKSWVRFVNLIPGVETLHPVSPIGELKPDWIKSAAEDYKRTKQSLADNFVRPISSVSRCPGIQNIFRFGYVVPAPMDFAITTWNDPQGRFTWESSVNYQNIDGHPYIDQHPPEQLNRYLKFRSDTLPTIIKVVTKWRVTMSPDIVLMQQPIPYPDHVNFSAVPGILDGQYECSVSIQLQWHRLNDTVLIPAGTPLCHYIPISRDLLPELRIERMNEDDEYLDQSWHYLHAKSFRKNRATWYKQAAKLIKDRISRL